MFPGGLFWVFLTSVLACQILVPQPGIEHVPPALGVQSLNHWTAREVPGGVFEMVSLQETRIAFHILWMPAERTHWLPGIVCFWYLPPAAVKQGVLNGCGAISQEGTFREHADPPSLVRWDLALNCWSLAFKNVGILFYGTGCLEWRVFCVRVCPAWLLWSLFQQIKSRRFLLTCTTWLALASSGDGRAVTGLGEDIHSKR